jgi:hypothetical protein
MTSSIMTNECLKSLKNLQSLIINRSQITDDGLIELTNLTYLNIVSEKKEYKITDYGISQLTKLNSLLLANIAISDHTIKQLTNLTHLNLRVTNNPISFDGIKVLTRLRKLFIGCNSS